MACLLTSGFSLQCRDNIGGIKRAYLANFDVDQTYTLDVDNNITDVTSSPPNVYYIYETEQEVGSFNQEGQYSIENGTVFFLQTVSLTMYKNDADLRNKLLVLSQANLSIVIEDQRGEFWLVGKENGARVTAGSQSAGQAYGDLNGVTLTFEAREPEPAHRIEGFSSIFTTSV